MNRRIVLQFETDRDERLFIQLGSVVHELRRNDRLLIEDFLELFHVVDLTVEGYTGTLWEERARFIFDEASGEPGPTPSPARVERG